MNIRTETGREKISIDIYAVENRTITVIVHRETTDSESRDVLLDICFPESQRQEVLDFLTKSANEIMKRIESERIQLKAA